MENLPDLDVKLVDQDELELEITRKANRALISKESELDEKRLLKTQLEIDKVSKKIKVLELRLANPHTKLLQRKHLKDEISWFEENELRPLQQDFKDIQGRLKGNQEQLESGLEGKNTSERMEGESEREYLVRTGKITAFGNVNAFASSRDAFQSHTNLRAPGFQVERRKSAGRVTDLESALKKEQNGGGPEKIGQELTDLAVESPEIKVEETAIENSPQVPQDHETFDVSESEDDVRPRKRQKHADSDDEFQDNGESEEIEDEEFQKAESAVSELEESESDTAYDSLALRNVDDGDETHYQERLRRWVGERSKLRNLSNPDKDIKTKKSEQIPFESSQDDQDEWRKPHPSIPDAKLDANFSLPGDIYPSLFEYQKTCVQWLWELYTQKTGGIIGDEMGLGKTIQVISFLAGLHHSGLLEKPVLLVVPATVLNQWVNEFHRWWPPLRCIILHSIGSGMSKNSIRSDLELERHLEAEDYDENLEISLRAANNQANAKEIVDRVMRDGHVLVTTYVGLRIYSKYILPHEWGYAVLDEGHKIRNPNSEISLACKRIKTYNRVILLGTPIQNNLIELWSLFDFVFPGRLGTLPVFEQQFAIPINMGGYANASNVQVQTGYKCAVILRDLISPYLLRRLKVDVAQDLPKKNEMVLFVKLTQFQQDMYEKFLGSEDVNAILGGKRNVLMGVDMLRKICNHPDLVDREMLTRKKGYSYGNPAKLGKMQVVKNLLQLWQSQGHRTLLFCQTKQMLDILEKFLANLRRIDPNAEKPTEIDEDFHYLRMDGLTAISKRQQLVDTFNNNEYYHVFLLTTKVGGLGVNLTGADRVIIFDPDWNPLTDIQARERAWRLGQKKDITIYRLMTAGTIEEKIYHRQIFKTFLTNKILKDPKQRRFFKLNDLHDLFTLGDQDEKGTETGDMFSGSEKTFSGSKERKNTRLLKMHRNDDDLTQVAKIMGVSKLDKFEGEEEEKDDGIMDGILGSNVHSMLQHDEIMNSLQELSLVEKEANRVAKEAADALKKSRMLARKKKIGTPTWTGKFGTAGRFGSVQRSGNLGISRSSLPLLKSPTPNLSLTSILTELRQRKAAELTSFDFGKKKKEKTDKLEVLRSIVEFLSTKPNGFSKSNEILLSLPKTVNLKNENELVMVRLLLREVADWKSGEKGWKLKETFMSQNL